MDISLPVSDSSTTAMFSAGASAKGADSGRFSQTLSREMADQPDRESNASEADAAKKTPQQAKTGNAQAGDRAQADSDENPSGADTNTSAENTSRHAGKTAETGKGQKKAASQGSDASTETTAANVWVEDTAEENTLQSAPEATGDSDGESAEATTDSTVAPAALEQAATTSTNSVLANGSTNPALGRSNAVHNEIFRSVRARTADASTAEINASHLASGKSLQNSGNNLPAGKADNAGEQANTFLPAGAQDWQYTTDSLITAVSDKAAKFDALNTRFNSQSAESFSILTTGTGKTLAAQSSLKSELAARDATYTSMSSDFLAGSEEWCQDFGTKIEWMSKENVTRAELSLHPAELGALDITINTEDDRISIHIVTHNDKSREMLESSMPRLNELLKSQGLALENSNISHNSASSQQNAHAQQPGSSFNLAPEEQQATELGVARSALVRHQGQIDHYV